MRKTESKNFEILDIAHIVDSPRLCPQCNEMMQGPYTSYRRREADLYFDLERKYEHCPYCGSDVDFVDLEVLIGNVSSKLPPSVARAFTMESIRMFGVVPEKVVNLLYTVMDDVQGNAEISKENLDLLETFTKTSHDLYHL